MRRDEVMKFKLLLSVVIVSNLTYFLSVCLINRVINYPIFFISIILSSLIPFVILFIIQKKYKHFFGVFTLFSIYIVSMMTILFFAIFGPVFIDRSVSYHIAFLAVEEKSINPNKDFRNFSDVILQKRIKDAQTAGIILKKADGIYVPTRKAYFLYNLLVPIGTATDTLEEYKKIRK